MKKPKSAADVSWLDQLELMAKSRNLFFSDNEKTAVIRASNDLIAFLTKLRDFVSGVPNERERESVSRSIAVLRNFADRSKNAQALALIVQKPALQYDASKKRQVGGMPVDIEMLMKELETLPTSNIEARLTEDKQLSLLDLSILARRLGLPAKSSDTRSQLIDRIASVGFANRRGYDLLRNDKNP